MSDIKNITDQLDLFASEMVISIKNLQDEYKLTFDQSVKVIELTIKNMQNEIEWQTLRNKVRR